MKKTTTTLLLLCAFWGTMKAEDGFTVSNVNLELGGEEKALIVGLSGTLIYTAYNMDIYLPDGIEVAVGDNGKYKVSMVKKANGIYPNDYDEDDDSYEYYHTLGVEFHVDENGRYLRIACTSNTNAEFQNTSGDLFRVYLKATNYCKPGTAQLSFSGLNLTEKNNEKHVPADFVSDAITVGDACSIAINITAANQFATCILPFAVVELPEGLKAYSALTASDGFVNLTEADGVEAYKPYILYAESGFSGILGGTVDENLYVTSATEGVLTGLIVTQNVSDGYILQNKGEETLFYKVGETPFALPAGKCYMTLSSDAAGYRFRIGTTNIETPVLKTDDAAYDLQGRPMTETQGLRIVNGKKVFVK